MEPIKVSAVVPVGKLNDDLALLKSWIPKAISHGMKVILVNDCIDHKTSSLLKDYVDKVASKNIQLLVGDFFGPGGARNRGLDEVQSDWVCFWDSDDLPDVQGVLLALEENQNAEVLIGNFLAVERGNTIGQSEKRVATSLFEIAMNPGLWRFVFRLSIIEENRFQKLYMGEDQLFLAQLSPFIVNGLRLKTNFYTYYYGGEAQLTSVKARMDHMEIVIRGTYLCLQRTKSNQERDFLVWLFTRQAMTLLKLGDANSKAFALRNLFLTKLPISYIHRLVSIFRIVRYGLLNEK